MKFTVLTNKLRETKKYWLTFVAFLFATFIIVAIFSLVADRDHINWLSTTSGLGREQMFPFVFTEDNDIYVMNSDLSITSVDNECSNVIYDADLSRIYYTHNDELYEYEVEKKERKLLTKGVKYFYLFEERTQIVYITSDNAIMCYDYNAHSSHLIRKAQDEYATPKVGEEIFIYTDYNSETDTYSLLYNTLEGDVYKVSEKLRVANNYFVWKDDKAISYYEGDELCVYNTFNHEVTRFMNASIVRPNNGNYYVKNDKQFADSYDSCTNIKYIITENDPEKGYGKLVYVSVNRRGTSVKTIDAICSGAVCYDEDNEVILYKVPDGENFVVTKSQKGSDGKALLTANSANTFMYEHHSCYFYYKTAKNEVYYIDTNDIFLKENLVSNNAVSMELYRNKPFVVVTNDDSTETIVLSGGEMITYNDSETRLYGNLDSKYFMVRRLKDSFDVSLDYVEGDSIKRIVNICNSKIIFDKQMNNVLFWNEGKLYVYRDGQITVAGEFDNNIVETLVVAKRK